MAKGMRSIIPPVVRSAIARSVALRRIRDRVAGRAYRCKALQGESDYNICVNSDMTVSCNCRDYVGSGHIGNLRQETLDAIFRGPVARRFREQLAMGRLPLAQCALCWELEPLPRNQAQARLDLFHTPTRGIMVENTVLCNLDCLACNRKQVTGIRRSLRMSLDDMEIVAKAVQACGIREVAFHNLGEPFLSPAIRQELEIIRKHNPGVRLICSTNGILLNNDEKRDAALLLDLLYFSIDGPSQEVAARYQRGCDFMAARENLRALVAYRNARGLAKPCIEWKYVVFAWNDEPEYVEHAVALAREAGADLISFWQGGGHRSFVSRRFREDVYFRNLGVPSWKGREVNLRDEKRG